MQMETISVDFQPLWCDDVVESWWLNLTSDTEAVFFPSHDEEHTAIEKEDKKSQRRGLLPLK